jgi:serine phosphatase RsbU (regulator of sigma subunit)
MAIRNIKILIITVLALLTTLQTSLSQPKWPGYDADSIVAQLRNLNSDTARLTALYKICTSHQNIDTLAKYANEELILAQRLGSDFHESEAIMCMARCHYCKGEYNKAMGCSFQALGSCDIVKHKSFAAEGYLLISYCHYRLGDFEKADKFCRRALENFEKCDNKVMIAEANRALALFCIDYHFYDLGKHYLSTASELDNNYIGIASDYMLHGYADYQKYTDSIKNDSLLFSALEKFQTCLTMTDSIKNYALKCQVLEYMANTYMTLSKHYADSSMLSGLHANNALIVTSQARKYIQEYGLDEKDISISIIETRAYIAKGDMELADKNVTYVQSKIESNNEKINCYGNKYYEMLAEYYKIKEDYKTAYYYIKKLQKFNYKRYRFDLGGRITKILAQEYYDKFVNDTQNEKVKRDTLFKTMHQRIETFNNCLAILLFVFAVVLLMIFINKIKQDTINDKLKRQNDAIDIQNEGLRRQETEFNELRTKYALERAELDHQKASFLKANTYIIKSLQHARIIQNMLMPSQAQINQIFGDCLIYWKPLQTVSGDFYWAIQILDTRIAVAADCTGHGVPGAFMSMLGISTLNDTASYRNIQEKGYNAADILETMRSKVIAMLHQDAEGAEQYDSMDMSVCILKKGSGKIQYAGANRPILIARKNGVEEHLPDEMPAGIDLMCNEPFTNNEIECEDGDIIYMYSDGITDQFGGRNGKMKFGSKRLKALIEKIYTLPFDQQHLEVQKVASQWTTTSYIDNGFEMEIYRPQLDDQLLIGFKI